VIASSVVTLFSGDFALSLTMGSAGEKYHGNHARITKQEDIIFTEYIFKFYASFNVFSPVGCA